MEQAVQLVAFLMDDAVCIFVHSIASVRCPVLFMPLAEMCPHRIAVVLTVGFCAAPVCGMEDSPLGIWSLVESVVRLVHGRSRDGLRENRRSECTEESDSCADGDDTVFHK